MTYIAPLKEIGAGITSRAVTETLYVSPNGNGSNGRTWDSAYQTIQAALDAASVDGDDCTQIVISPHTTYYDINMTGDPTWTGNYEIIGSHRIWAPVRNEHATATSIMNFTGQVSIRDLAIFQIGTINGVSFTGNGARIRHCGFNSEGLTAAGTSIYLDGSGTMIQGAILEDVQVKGHATWTKGIHLEDTRINEISHIHIHSCLTGIHLEGALTDENSFHDIDIGDCGHVNGIGIDIDAGNEQYFDNIDFHHNTRNVDDEVGDSIWANIHGSFPIYIYPDDFTGITLASDAVADTWGALVDIVAANAIDNPFRIVGIVFDPTVSQWSRVRFTADNGTIYYDDVMFEASRQSGSDAPSGTEFIFNADTRIEATTKVAGAGPDNIVVWIAIQEI